jgi:hypothetical protein
MVSCTRRGIICWDTGARRCGLIPYKRIENIRSGGVRCRGLSEFGRLGDRAATAVMVVVMYFRALLWHSVYLACGSRLNQIRLNCRRSVCPAHARRLLERGQRGHGGYGGNAHSEPLSFFDRTILTAES